MKVVFHAYPYLTTFGIGESNNLFCKIFCGHFLGFEFNILIFRLWYFHDVQPFFNTLKLV
ncbi:hypothetical protein DESC_290097 [Desulfosarcina cetonica]|nr:hypothetical protein DESC_290097 [Desulfosarcina cetonica]